MTVKNEIREERNDVFSFWEMKPQLNETQDAIIEVETKLEECTIVDLEKRIEEIEKQILELNAKIALDISKIALINDL